MASHTLHQQVDSYIFSKGLRPVLLHFGEVKISRFGNPPSNGIQNNPNIGDIPNARRNEMGVTGNSYVLAQGNSTVYIYNGNGVQATFPFKQFFSIGIK